MPPSLSRPAGCALVVDVDPAVRGFLAWCLRVHGLTAHLAGGGLADADLPGEVALAFVGGPAAAAALRQLRPGLPCCLVIVNAFRADPGRLEAAGVGWVLAKPFCASDVAGLLRRMLSPAAAPSGAG